MSRPSGEHNLIEWTAPLLTDKRKLKKIVDPRLKNQYPLKAAVQLAELITHCLESDPRKRPSMQQVLDNLVSIYTIEDKPIKKGQ